MPDTPDVFDEYLRELAAGFAARKAPDMLTDEDDDEYEYLKVEHKALILTVSRSSGSGNYELNNLLSDGWHIDVVSPAGAHEFTSYLVQLVRFVEDEPAGE